MKLRKLIAAFAVFASAWLSKAQEADIMDIASLTSQGSYEVALDSLRLMVQRDSLDDAVWYYIGVCHSQMGRGTEAASAFLKAQELDPNNPDYRSYYILDQIGLEALSSWGDYELAAKCFRESLEKQPNDIPAILGLSESLRMQGNWAGYFSSIQPFLTCETEDAGFAVNYLSQVFKELDARTYALWHEKIDAMPQTLASTHPRDSAALLFAGSWFLSTGQNGKSMEYFRQWRDLDPTNISAQNLLIYATERTEGEEAALAECREALKWVSGAKERSSIYSTMGNYLYQLGHENKAFKSFEQALKLNPDDITTLNNYAYFLSLSGKKLRKAEKMSRRVLESNPDNDSYLDTYGWILHLLGRDAQAKPYFKRAMIYGGKESATVLLHYAEVLEALGEKDLADYYRKLAEMKEK